MLMHFVTISTWRLHNTSQKGKRKFQFCIKLVPFSFRLSFAPSYCNFKRFISCLFPYDVQALKRFHFRNKTSFFHVPKIFLNTLALGNSFWELRSNDFTIPFPHLFKITFYRTPKSLILVYHKHYNHTTKKFLLQSNLF